MKRLIGFGSVVFVALALTLGTTAAYAENPPGYTDGTTIAPNTLGPGGTQLDFGPPPGTPEQQTIDGIPQICIDPSSYIIITMHISYDGVKQAPLVFPYERNFPGLACTPWTPPPCPVETVTVFATWNFGTGQSGTFVLENECTPTTTTTTVPPPPPNVDPCEAAQTCDHEVDVPTAPVATPVLTDITELALTGPDPVQLVLTAGIAVAFLALGFLMMISTRHEVQRRRGLKL